MSQLTKRLDQIENEIRMLKTLISGESKIKKKTVSFRGLAKTKLSTKKIDEAIEKSRKSLFHHEEI